MIIFRNYALSEKDDYRLNVLVWIHSKNYAKPIRDPKNGVVGWKIYQ
ncbi:hypothetical protein [Brevibacillus fulvus]|uniref:Uncharacterized protein n=1 Tax=Brevibacillus fulvus TaxID=1125967 RepID=A0A938XS66_9BACL|nr:hypothetical protein [Brevibacillus fulvus]MBM7588952.1 hypothetical protein [Brevibacillus fulvus]